MTVTPFMKAFFASSAEYLLRHPDDPARFLERHPDWDAAPQRLAIYGRFVQGYQRNMLETLFPGCRSLVSAETWDELVRAHYRSGSSTHWERISHSPLSKSL